MMTKCRVPYQVSGFANMTDHVLLITSLESHYST
jgi:hypothetical protein